tara:strand:+ start:589 stop:771 length:183 start_codon:yes stop_codon:yes gene_type:complete
MGGYEKSLKKMIKVILNKLLKKHGSVGLFILVGDFIVKKTKSKQDDKMWKEVKKVLKNFG